MQFHFPKHTLPLAQPAISRPVLPTWLWSLKMCTYLNSEHVLSRVMLNTPSSLTLFLWTVPPNTLFIICRNKKLMWKSMAQFNTAFIFIALPAADNSSCPAVHPKLVFHYYTHLISHFVKWLYSSNITLWWNAPCIGLILFCWPSVSTARDCCGPQRVTDIYSSGQRVKICKIMHILYCTSTCTYK